MFNTRKKISPSPHNRTCLEVVGYSFMILGASVAGSISSAVAVVNILT